MTPNGTNGPLYPSKELSCEIIIIIMKKNQYFSIVNSSFCADIHTNTMTHSRDLLNDPILDPEMAHFILRRTLHKKIF
mgnify:CR=1 FL=1